MNGLWDLVRYERSDAQMPGRTVPEVFLNAAKARADRVWMREKKLGLWRAWTWSQAAAAVRETAMGLAALGLQPADCASILSNTRLEWLLADLGIQCAGGAASTSSGRVSAGGSSATASPLVDTARRRSCAARCNCSAIAAAYPSPASVSS